MDVDATWALFDEVAAEVRAAVVRTDLGAEGERAGQYGLDLVADAIVVDRLTAAGFGVMSEESGRHHADREVCVVVDPVDGSTNASRGLPCWATSLCAVDDEGMAVATVVDQSRGVVYRASRHGGASRQIGGGAPQPISVADAVPLADAIVAVNGWSAVRPQTRQFRALGAAAIELCLVADGSLDGYVGLEADAHGPWDYLGALLVLTEAGGVAADVAGRPLVITDHAERRTLRAASAPSLLDAMMQP